MWIRFYIAVLVFLGLFWLQEIDERIYHWSWLLLAAGIAWEVSRHIARHPVGFHRLVRRTLAWLVVAVAALAGSILGFDAFWEHREIASLPPPRADSPNVLLIVLDTVRAKSMSVCGAQRRTTPKLEEFATEGVRFDRAFVTAPWTLPSHASMFTGRLPTELFSPEDTPEDCLALDGRYATVAEVLRGHGYRTGGFVANLAKCLRETGLGRGFTHYEDLRPTTKQLVRGCELNRTIMRCLGSTAYSDAYFRYDAPEITDAFLDWVSEDESRPFFAFLNYMEAHSPYLPPGSYDGLFGDRPLDDYDECIAMLDDEVARLLAALRTKGTLRRTLVIVTSDHGEQFGEHGLFDHGNSLYLPLLHVPLVIVMPNRIPTDRSVQTPVSLCDLPATVLELVGLKTESTEFGSSLAVHWSSSGAADGPTTRPVLATVNVPAKEKDPIRSLIAGQYHYLVMGDGEEELYDYLKDPEELHNLVPAGTDSGPMPALRDALKRLLPDGK